MSSLIGLREALAKYGLLGSSIIPRSFDPSVFVKVQYPRDPTDGGRKGIEVTPGETYAVRQDQDPSFTLALLDPDAPTRSDPEWAPFRHWLVAGLEAGSPAKLAGEVMTAYMGPAPPEDTGPHRYAFLLYRQPAGAPPKFVGDKGNRKQYDIAKFVDENQLVLIGANFFLAENAGKEDV